MNIEQLYTTFKQATGISTDTRTIKSGNIFFALKGGNFNGNKYAKQALSKGAILAIVDEEVYCENNAQYGLVNNVLHTLQNLAKYHRQQLNIPVLAITGSNGKTTTKELINAVLSTTYNVLATKGNLNNHIGVPLTLLSITEKHNFAIVEMGANHVGEIASYCQWALPNYGLITNIGKAHLEGFGGVEGIIKGKTELYKALLKNSGTVFYNTDDAVLTKHAMLITKQVGYGTTAKAQINAQLIEAAGNLKMIYNGNHIETHLVGNYNFYNALSAIAIGVHFKVSENNIVKALGNYKPNNNRSQLTKWQNNQVILDAYNANPTSMHAAITNLAEQPQPNKVAVLGDMFELGETELNEHRQIVELGLEQNFSLLVFVGTRFFKCKTQQPNCLFFETTQQAKKWLQTSNLKQHIILIKGSRGMRLESLIA